ncbi:MAG: M28 family peptidase [Firmicutes bacterium]|nr:M28 family peptidase [Bacillota bacterium]
MKKQLWLTFSLLSVFFVAFAGKFVLIPLSETNNLGTLFNNKELKIHYYCDDYVLATTENLTYSGTLVLDDNAFENDRPYTIVHCFDTYKEDYLAKVSNSAEILYAGKEFLIMKFLSEGFVPAKNDGIFLVRNKEAKLPKTSRYYPVISRIDPSVQSLIEKINTDSLMTKIQHLQDYGTRGYFKPQAYDAQEWIKSKFETMGLDVELQYFSTAGNWMGTPDTSSANIIAIQRGTKYPNEYVVCGAHYDSYSYGWEKCPGADDNASGTSGILETARILSQYKFERSIIYCCFSAEEIGLYGSDAYASRCCNQELDIVGYLNMDGIGYLWEGEENRLVLIYNDLSKQLADFYTNICNIYFPEVNLVYHLLTGEPGSDYGSFHLHGYQAISSQEGTGLSSLYRPSPYWHTPKDTIGLSVNSPCQVSMFTKALSANIATLAKMVPNNVTEVNHKVSFYPNPANDKLFIEGEFIGQNIEIFDINGKLVARKTADANITRIEITHLTQGVYFVKISNIAVGKFVKR